MTSSWPGVRMVGEQHAGEAVPPCPVLDLADRSSRYACRSQSRGSSGRRRAAARSRRPTPPRGASGSRRAVSRIATPYASLRLCHLDIVPGGPEQRAWRAHRSRQGAARESYGRSGVTPLTVRSPGRRDVERRHVTASSPRAASSSARFAAREALHRWRAADDTGCCYSSESARRKLTLASGKAAARAASVGSVCRPHIFVTT